MNTHLLVFIFLPVVFNVSVNGQSCSTICEWVEWLEWESCSVSCGGGGVQQRNRPLCCIEGYTNIEDCALACSKNLDEFYENRTCGEGCLHGGSMKFDGNGCECMNRTFGQCCEELLPSCTPFPTDVIFVLDSSASQSTEQFGKQLDFVIQFINHVNISEEEFQIAIVTFSFEALVEINFNQSTDKDTLRNLINEIQFRPGATFTDKGLDVASDVARQSERRKGMVALTYAFVLTDGMSFKRDDTRTAAQALRDAYVHVIAIGIGNEVSQQELIDIASPGDQHSPSYVFSVGDFNSLYTLLKQLVDITCDDCTTVSHFSDILFLLDEGNYMTEEEFEISVKAMTSIVTNTDNIGEHEGSMFGLRQLGNALKETIPLSSELLQSKIQRISRFSIDFCSQDEPCIERNITTAINESFHNYFNSSGREDARKFIVLLTNGRYEKPNLIKDEMSIFNSVVGVKVIVIGVGRDVNMEGLLSLANEAIDVFVSTDGGEETEFIILQSEFTYNVCTKH